MVRIGKTNCEFASSLDVFPTLCAAAGIELTEQIPLDGTNLIPYLSGKANGVPHESLFWSNGPNIAVRSGDWKLIQSHQNVWLFDLSEDLGEQHNLAKSHPEKVKELQQAYRQWRSGMEKPAWPSKPRRRKVQVDGMTYEMNI